MIDLVYVIVLFIIVILSSMMLAGAEPIHGISTTRTKINDKVVSVPPHVLKALLIKCKDALNVRAKKGVPEDADTLEAARLVERKMQEYVEDHYGMKFNLGPVELEQYFLDHGIDIGSAAYTRGAVYDEEIHVEIDSTTTHVGRIIWYIEQILIMGRDSKSIYIDLDEVNILLDRLALSPHQQAPRLGTDSYRETPSVPHLLPPHVDVIDDEQWRYPFGPPPKKCSTNLRHDLQNFISDSAAQDWDEISDLYDGGEKNKNLAEARESWKNPAALMWQVDVSHPIESGMISDLCDVRPTAYLRYGGYDLAINTGRADRTQSGQKQSLTDAWEYLEQDLISG